MEELILAAILHSSSKHNIDPQLVQAIVRVESNYNPKAIGKSHKERGLMQLRPDYFVKADFSINGNIEQGVAYLAHIKPKCIAKYGKNAWFIGYNLGPNRVGIKDPTKVSYYKKVMHAKKEIAKRDQTNRGRTVSSQREDDVSQVDAEGDSRARRGCTWGLGRGGELYLHQQGTEPGSSSAYPLA